MSIFVTRCQTTGTPGRRLPGNPSVLVLDFRLFAQDVADQVFVAPALAAKNRKYGVMTQFAQVADVGANLIVQMVRQSDGEPLDISAASSLQIIVGFPNGVMETKTAQLLTNGLDGKLYYVTQDGDLPEMGFYSIQGKVVIGGSTLYSEVAQFQVLDNVEASGGGPVPDPHFGTFTQADLVGNKFTINHYKGLAAPYSITVTIFDSNGNLVQPDSVEGFENSVAVDLTSFAPLSGTWGYVYL